VNAPARERQQACPLHDSIDSGMTAAGLQKTSLIDYPGKVSCVVFIAGCNFTCPFCHNPDLALGRPPRRIDLTELYAFLEERRTFLDGVVITGGEPTLQPGLGRLCQDIRAMGLSVKLDTNGSRPEILEALLDTQLVDYVAMDVKTAPHRYGPPLCPGNPEPMVRESIRLIMQKARDYEFRTTCLAPFSDEENVTAIAQAIKGAKRYVLQRFRPAIVLSPDYFKTAGPVFSEERMIRLRQIAAPRVETCLVR
jgi:pyruvate formate lyase activating enzyme